MRRLLEMGFVVLVAGCGGVIDDGTDSGVDAGIDGKSDAIAKPDTAPTCTPDNLPCKSSSQCCSNACSFGVCGAPPPPPPPCKPDGVSCASDVECCSNACDGTCGISVACASSSTKKCDQCVAMSCCKQTIDCQNDPTCTMWLSCVQNCEQQNQSAFTCSQPQGQCGPPQNVAETALFKCAQQFCGNVCTVD